MELSPSFDWIGATPTLVVLGALFVADLIGDKIPAIDSVLHLFGLVVAPASGAIVFAAQENLLSNAHPVLAGGVGLVLGGSVHAARSTIRPAVTATTGGIGNPIVSFVEDAVSLVLTVLAVVVPVLAVHVAVREMFAALDQLAGPVHGDLRLRVELERALAEAGLAEAFARVEVVEALDVVAPLTAKCEAEGAFGLIVGRIAGQAGGETIALGAVARGLLRGLVAPIWVVPPDLTAAGIGGGAVLVAVTPGADSVGAVRVGAPCSPGDEKVQPKAKARFQHPPLGLVSPGRGQAAALQKHAAGLVQPPVFTVVAVAKAGAVGGAVGQPVDGLGHGVCKC